MAKSTSPKGGKRGCLCEDGKTYSADCCQGEVINQGIGTVTGSTTRTSVENPDGSITHTYVAS